MTARKPLVSIVMPAYNSAKTIRRAIENIAAQSYSNMEIVVVDDSSTDDTAKIVKSVNDPRIKLVEREHNGGASSARNSGIDAATGDYVLFIDSDDRIANDMVEKMLNKAEAYPESLVVCGKQIGTRKISVSKNILVSKNIPMHVVTSILKGGHLYSPCNKIYRLDIIKSNNIRFIKKIEYGEDLIFNLDYLKHVSAIYYLKDCLYFYDLTSEGTSFRTKSEYKYRAIMLEHLRGYLGDNMRNPGVAIKYNLIQLRWQISVKRAKRKQDKRP